MFLKKIIGIHLVKWCLYVFLAVCLYFAGWAIKVINKSCSFARAEDLLLNLCTEYHRHEIDGNMCRTLCDKKELILEQCGNNRGSVGRKDVLIMRCDGCGIVNSGSKLVMKQYVQKSVWSTVTTDVLRNNVSNEHMITSTEEFVASKVRVFDTNSFTTEQEILAGILGGHYRRKLTSNVNSMDVFVSLKTVIALTIQHGLIEVLAFQKLALVPKFYGYCGPAYFQEHTESLSSLGYVTTYRTKSPELLKGQRHDFSWADRARLAIRYLHLLRRVETVFIKPLQICDGVSHNIGLNSDNDLVFLDSDDCAFDHAYRDKSCIVDGDCAYSRCGGICDKQKGKCFNKRTNNNIMTTCQYLFIGDHGLLGSKGLLRSPPEVVRKELNDILQRCAFPYKYNISTATDPSGFLTMNQLERILTKSINGSKQNGAT